MGLSSAEVENLLKKQGLNEIPQKRQSLLSKAVKSLFSPISAMLILAAFLSFFAGKVFDANFILVLLLVNIGITLWQENKADNAIQKLNENLSQKVRVFRDNVWSYIDSKFLVEGDVIRLAVGEIVPADGWVIEANNVSVNESALTGESLPKDKINGDKVFSGSFLTSGIAVIKVTATGIRTGFGKTIFSVETIRKKSLLEKDVISVSKFLTTLSLIAVLILSVVFLIEKAPLLELLTLDLSLVIAGIPVSLPTVITLIIEFGVLALAVKNAVVRRLSALEDLANVNLLLSDKTGTLTQNKITVENVYSFGKYSKADVLIRAAQSAALEGDNPLDRAILDKLDSENLSLGSFKKLEFIPFDSKRKRSTAVIEYQGVKSTICVGAPQVIASLCSLDAQNTKIFEDRVEALAKDGFRALAVAKGAEEKEMELIGLLSLSDALRPDAKAVTAFLEENGIRVCMVTGDNRAIASQISRQLSLGGRQVVARDELDKLNQDGLDRAYFLRVGAFAEVLPEDKLNLVQAAKQFFVVAANGDGINDLPAIKAANVGIAVKNAVAALKSAADIVLLSDGIGVIKDAIIESRKIFERIYSYSVYRISESFRLIITIAVLGILYRVYPLTPLQIILIALLNDIPIISLAFDRVKITNRPAEIKVKERFVLSSLYGLTGVANSLLLFFLTKNILNLPWNTIQTMFFLKLTVSGHLLIYVAHTKERWFKFLPSKQVIWATTITQLAATTLALLGFLMPGKLTIEQVVFIWLWSFFWMQVGEGVKIIQQRTAAQRSGY